MSIASTAINRVTNTVAESVYDNPVMTREFRTRMRGWKAFGIMGGYVLLLAIFLFIHYLTIANESPHNYGYYNPLGNLQIGHRLFGTLAWTQAIMLMFIVPSLTAGAITQELEKKTIEMLALTRLSAGKIVLGKHLSGFFYALMLLACSAPLAGICLMLGGISPAEVIVTYALLASTSFLFAALSIACSSLMNKSAGSALLSYMICIGYMALTSPLGSTALMARYSRNIYAMSLLNPIFSAYGAALARTRVCGIELSAALCAFVVEMAVGLLALLIASTHVKHRKVERALSIRLMMIFTLALIIWLGVGSLTSLISFAWRPSTAEDMKGILYVASIIIASILCLMAAAIATGEMKNAKGSLLTGALSCRKMFKSDVRGAVVFMTAMSAIAYAIFTGTLYWVAKVESVPVYKWFWSACIKNGIAMTAVVAGLSAIGILFSSIITKRKNAAALVVFIALVAFIAYGFVLSYYQINYKHSVSFIGQTAVFWPVAPVIGLANEWGRSMPPLMWNPHNSWIVTSAAYLLIGLIALAIAGPALRKTGGVKDDMDE
jgi:ABC-type transport system involved in multi-copper enzyme maturation permease subunit